MIWTGPHFINRKIEGKRLNAIILSYTSGLCSLIEKCNDWNFKRENTDETGPIMKRIMSKHKWKFKFWQGRETIEKKSKHRALI